MAWEHLRFVALLIPTWLLLGAAAVTLTVSSKGAAGTSTSEGVQSALAACSDPGGVAVQQRKRELVVAAEWNAARSPEEFEK